MGMYMNFNWQLYQQLMKITTKDDILLANDLDALLPNYLVSKKKKCKLVFDSHEIFSEMPSLTERKIKKWLWKKLENRLMPRSEERRVGKESRSGRWRTNEKGREKEK